MVISSCFFANLLTKCEAPRLLAVISRIMKLDDLSNKIPHHITTADTIFHNILVASDGSSTPISYLPSNHDFLIASFTPREISRVMQLLQSHEGLLLQTLQLALQAQDFQSIFSYLISEIKKNTKSLFLPYYLPTDSMFTLYVTGNPPVTQLRTNQALKLEPLFHLSIQLGLQILNRSTHLELHSNYEKGDMYISSPYRTSVTSKHCFESLFFFN